MLLFRADGNNYIGAGHIMRCISIADAAKRLGHDCIFVSADNNFESVISSHGHEVVVLNTDYTSLDNEPLSSIIETYKPKAVIIDSYFVTYHYLKKIWKLTKIVGAKLVYIDDVLAFPYLCDVLVNYNIYVSDADYKALYSGVFSPQFLLGTKYAPLRAEFQNLQLRLVKPAASNIMISTGGADFEHMMIELITAAKNVKTTYIFHFIIGPMNRDRKEIYELAKSNHNIVLHENVTKMADLMQLCDVAISAAGSTLYELCATQTPAIIYITADNQLPGAEGFSKYNILENIGDVRKLGTVKLALRLVDRAIKLADDYEARIRISTKQKYIVDGKGAERIIEAVLR